MTNLSASQLRLTLCRCALLISILLPVSALADNWQLQVGAQNGNRSHQALAFLPNEIWIHSGDSITWAFVANEVHTVTFLTPLQVRPNRFTGCPGGGPPDGRTRDFSVYDGTACVNSGILTSEDGQTYTVVFPVTGNFKLVCLAHPNMTATIHVLAISTPLPHDQAFYDKEADRERAALLSDVMASGHNHSGPNEVTAGVGHIIGNGGGTQTPRGMGFLGAKEIIHFGGNVEWATAERGTGPTITLGSGPAPLQPISPSWHLAMDPGGAPDR